MKEEKRKRVIYSEESNQRHSVKIWHSINTTRIKFDLRNLSEILYSLDCRCTRWKRKDIWNRFKFDGGHRIGVDIDTKR